MEDTTRAVDRLWLVIGGRDHPPLDAFLAPNPGVASGRRAHIPPHAEMIVIIVEWRIWSGSGRERESILWSK